MIGLALASRLHLIQTRMHREEQPTEPNWSDIEQPAGLPLVTPVDRAAVEAHRREAYLSYERFLRQQLAALDRDRPAQWRRDYSNPPAYARSIAPMRRQLCDMLGFWIDPSARSPLKSGEREILHDEKDFTASRFTLEILPGISTYAVELAPKSPARSALLVQHGYAGTPEVACGLTANANAEDYSYRSLGLRAVRRGFHVLAIFHPSGYGKLDDEVSGVPGYSHQPAQYGKNRLHRLAIMAGGTMFGLDMMACSRGVDLLLQTPGIDANRVGIYGLSQGGQTALYLPAMDTRITASVCSAYFNHRYPKLVGPSRAMSYLDSNEEDKFFSHVISTFSDADLVSLIAPRAFGVEAGLHDGSVDFERSREEFARARMHYEKLGVADRIEYIPHAEGHVSATHRAMDFLVEQLQA
jgi:hypothetical protein